MSERRTDSSTRHTERPWHVYMVFDGGSLGNPGKGYGSYVYKGVVSQLEPVSIEYPGKTTNNEAEYMTCVAGLQAILDQLAEKEIDASRLTIAVKSDSKLVVEQVNGNWKVKEARLRPLVKQVQELLNRFDRWHLTWHSRSESVRILGH